MRSNSLWLCFLLLTFMVTLPVSWLAMSKVDFFYPSLHDNIGIDQHIQVFSPRNRFNKMEFEKTTKEERVSLFQGVVSAIHNKGEGLDSLAYIQSSNNKSILLFTEAEVTHLKDVAKLVDKAKPVVLGVVLFWLFLVACLFVKRIKIPSTKYFSVLFLVLFLLLAIVLTSGPERVFNQLHIWAFPDNHQWFFFYEESLMSTMMKAPDLFAYIAAIWGGLSILMTIALLKLVHLTQFSKR